MSRFGKRLAIAAFATIALAHPAFAASPEEIATARELYKAGADALDAGNAQVAVDKLGAAWGLLKTPVIGLALARAQDKLGHLVESREAALATLQLPKAPDETSLSVDARAEATKLVDALRTRVPHVMIVVTGPDAEVATVKLDGIAIPPIALRSARQTNPGLHTVAAQTEDGRHVEVSVSLAESETKDATLVLPPALDKPERQPTDTEPHLERTQRSTSPLVWVGLTIGGIGLVTGAISGSMAFASAGSLGNDCNTNKLCPSSSSNALSFAQTTATISTIGFVTFGVGAIMLVTGLLIGGPKHVQGHARIVPTLDGLAGTF